MGNENNVVDMNRFAYDWIIELKVCERGVRQAFLNRNRDWHKKVEYAIKKEVWEESYRKVSQLCYTIGGDIQQKFEDEFPYENKNYKTGYLLEED